MEGQGKSSLQRGRAKSFTRNPLRPLNDLTRRLTVAGALFLLGALLWVLPKLFNHEADAREGIVTLLIGLLAVGLAVHVVYEMGRDAWRERVAAGERHARHHQVATAARARVRHRRRPRTVSGPALRLGGVDLREATLPGIDLDHAELVDAVLSGADLNAATLRASGLADADLRDADLRDADLRDADLRSADLRDADLRGADLRGASLLDAALDGARLEGSIYHSGTRWPETMEQPEELGAVHIEDEK